MSKVDSWLPLYVADYRADTTRLSTEQHGAYMLLIMDYWRNGQPPDDDRVLAQITGLPLARWKAHRPIIQPFFTVECGKWRHGRIEKELTKARNNNLQKSEAGKASAAKRWGNGEDNGEVTDVTTDGVTAEQRQNAPSPSPTQSSLPAPESPTPKKRGAKAPFVLPEWIPEEPWNAWIEARTRAKKPPTEWAKRLAVQKLDNLREQGHPPAQVLMDAAFNNWSGLFPPKEVR